MPALVVALNPCIDAEWLVDNVVWEEKNSILSERRWAGGKGINVARWLGFLARTQPAALQPRTRPGLTNSPNLLLPLGGQSGAELAGHLRLEKLKVQSIRVREPNRVNVIVTTAAVRQLRFNPLGPTISSREWNSLQQQTRRLLAGADCLILSGSLPRGLPVTAYGTLIRLTSRTGVRTILDCDGPSLAAAISARPFLVKPNVHELAQWRGKPLRTQSAIVQAATALSRTTRGWVLVSRGAAGGLLLHQQKRTAILAHPPCVVPVNTIGAGDALLAAAAWQIQLGASPEEWLRWGVAAGTAATHCRAGELPSPVLVKTIFQRVACNPTGRP